MPPLSPMVTFGAISFATCTALANAVAVTTQHVASQRPKGAVRGLSLALAVLRQPLWWLGGIALFGSLVFQALALHFGPLSLVQPFLISELLMALVLRRFWRRQRIVRRAWVAGALVVISLTAFLILSAPSTGRPHTSARTWAWTMGTTLLAMGVVAVLGRRGTDRHRAGAWGTITAVLWALEAALIKGTTDSIAVHGLGGAFLDWPLYAFVVIGLAGLAAEQTALFVGPLAVSQPCIVIFDPLASILFGVILYGEHWRSGTWSILSSVLTLLILCLSAYQLMMATPDTLHPTGSGVSLPTTS